MLKYLRRTLVDIILGLKQDHSFSKGSFFKITMFANTSRVILLILILFGLAVSGNKNPEMIKNFYEQIFSSPWSTFQTIDNIKDFVHDDYEMRPNDFFGSDPSPEGIKKLMKKLNKMLPGLYYEPISTHFCR